jgi:deazaflavin-dependent oxidoreductase (nitroreductase family)
VIAPKVPAAWAVPLLALPAVAVVYGAGVRSRSPVVRAAARRFHHAIGNPVQLRTAGRKGRFASVLRHRGRRTGRTYETPVWAARTEDGFVIPVVYGPRTDWVRNLEASGEGELVHDAVTYRIDEPRVVPMADVRAHFPVALQRTHRLLRVDRALRVRGAPVPGPGVSEQQQEETMQRNDGRVVPYADARRFMREAIRSTHHKPLMHGLVEVDVTRARAAMRDVEARTGEAPSFTAFVIGCLGRAVDEHKEVHALWKGRRHLVLFDEVDVLTWIERDLGGRPVVLPAIVRAANRRSFEELHADIRAAQTQDPATIAVGGTRESQVLPAWAYRPYFALVTRVGKRFPKEWKRTWGTITLTAVGMEGRGAAWWGIPPSSPSICWITVGGIGSRREEVDGRPVVREYLDLTVTFDHNMVDAAPATRFTARLVELIQSGYGLPIEEDAAASEHLRRANA